MAGEQVVEAGLHDVVGPALHAKISAQRGAGPGDGTGLREHGVLESGEVADAHELHAIFNGARHGCVVDAGQDAREAVAAARDQRHVGAAGGRAVDGGQACGIVAGKAGVHSERIGVDLDLVPQGLQTLHAPAKGRLVTHRAGRRIDVDVLGAVVVAAAARGMVVIGRQGVRAP